MGKTTGLEIVPQTLTNHKSVVVSALPFLVLFLSVAVGVRNVIDIKGNKSKRARKKRGNVARNKGFLSCGFG
jgi:hypothetical protein